MTLLIMCEITLFWLKVDDTAKLLLPENVEQDSKTYQRNDWQPLFTSGTTVLKIPISIYNFGVSSQTVQTQAILCMGHDKPWHNHNVIQCATPLLDSWNIQIWLQYIVESQCSMPNSKTIIWIHNNLMTVKSKSFNINEDLYCSQSSIMFPPLFLTIRTIRIHPKPLFTSQTYVYHSLHRIPRP